MKILSNTTSPYARIARIALAEKGFDIAETQFVDPWGDDAALVEVNPAVRVPPAVTDAGLPIAESLLILLWLEKKTPEPLLEGPLDLIILRAGRAMGVIDAMVHIIIGVMRMDPGWGEMQLGLRRRRRIVNGFRAIEADPPVYFGHGAPNIAVMTTIVALDYLRLRFKDAAWVAPLPKLDALRQQLGAVRRSPRRPPTSENLGPS